MNVMHWGEAVYRAIADGDVDRLARLLAENDPNGVYAYGDFCNEFGETSRGEWGAELIECGRSTLAELPQHLTSEECVMHAETLEKWAKID